VSHLLTVYSQSRSSNAGTRGLDVLGEQTYVETGLDRDLVPAVLAGEFKLVVISGNAGDGKTAFLQKLETRAQDEGAVMDRSMANGCRFEFGGRKYLSNYDGSQDEGEQTSDAVVRAFLEPFAGEDANAWPGDQVRLIAINEGRLVDFLSTEKARFPLLSKVISAGLVSGEAADGVAVINLNLRSVVTDPLGYEGDPKGGDESILARLVRRDALVLLHRLVHLPLRQAGDLGQSVGRRGHHAGMDRAIAGAVSHSRGIAGHQRRWTWPRGARRVGGTRDSKGERRK
jgi:hypothetical protein